MSEPSGFKKDAIRIDKNVQFKQPPQKEIPSPEPVPTNGGNHGKPTLPSFSLQGKTAIITGAGGLGLVMAQGMMTSGADIALVDLNGMHLD